LDQELPNLNYPHRSTRLTLPPQILLRIVLFSIGIVLAELSLALLDLPPGWSRPVVPTASQLDPELGWDNQPGKYRLTDNQREFNVTYSKDRSRMSTTREAPSEMQAALILLGDSFVDGFGVDDTETLAWLIQEQNPELQVKNFGVGGYGAVHALLKLRRVIASGEFKHGSVWYIFNSFDEDRSSGRFQRGLHTLRASAELKERLYVPVASIAASGSLEIASTLQRDFWAISRHFRVPALANLLVEQLTDDIRAPNDREITLALIQTMQQEAQADNLNFEVILFDGDPKLLQKYDNYLSQAGVSTQQIPIDKFIGLHYRQADGHPTGNLNRAIVPEFLKMITTGN